MSAPNTPFSFSNGLHVPNRYMLAPLTNLQSHDDGSLSEAELHWLTMRAKGGFGIVMTCATSVMASGKGFKGQLGLYDDHHIAGHQQLCQAIHDNGAVIFTQLHHAGMRSPKELIQQTPVCPSDDMETGARAVSISEIHDIRDSFIQAAHRAQQAGYDGAEIHAAHGYLLCQFLSKQYNRRTDEYGGSMENRFRLIEEILQGIHDICGEKFTVGIRFSPERFGMEVDEVLTWAQYCVDKGLVHFIDFSLWDIRKEITLADGRSVSLLKKCLSIQKGNVHITVAGKIQTANDVCTTLQTNVDFVSIGRSGILHHDFPKQVTDTANFCPQELPVSPEYLEKQGLSGDFIQYMKNWPGFVSA